MPRGGKPTTPALALKDGWVYEDTLPPSITKEQYDWWFKESLVLDGVRMGPSLTTKPQSTTEILEPCPSPDCRSIKATASNDFANYYVYCPDCFLRGPRESVDSLGARWNALPRISPASAAPVVDENATVEQIASQFWVISNQYERSDAQRHLASAIKRIEANVWQAAIKAAKVAKSRCDAGANCYDSPAEVESASAFMVAAVTSAAATAAPRRARCVNCAESLVCDGDKWTHEFAYRPECTIAAPRISE